MRLTCLKCGHQIELASPPGEARLSCVCGQDYTYPNVLNTGTRPNERAAERSRYRAFRAAGLVKNFGGFALGISLLGALFFPIALVGAGIGIYVLTMVRGPMRRYSGRRQALGAVALGAAIFVLEGGLWLRYFEHRRNQHLETLQEDARDDLRRLLRSERLYRVSSDTYGTFGDCGFRADHDAYTIYLSPDDVLPARRDGKTITDPLPDGLKPGFSANAFTAVAVANLDSDPDLDIWLQRDEGPPIHLRDDVSNTVLKSLQPPPAKAPAPAKAAPAASSALAAHAADATKAAPPSAPATPSAPAGASGPLSKAGPAATAQPAPPVKAAAAAGSTGAHPAPNKGAKAGATATGSKSKAPAAKDAAPRAAAPGTPAPKAAAAKSAAPGADPPAKPKSASPATPSTP